MADTDPTAPEARLAAVLGMAVDAIIVIDEKSRILMYNAACETLFGYSADEVMGRNVKLIMPPDYANQHDQYMTNYMTTGVRKIIGIGRDVLARHKDGTVFPVELSVGAATHDGERQFIGILRDLRPRVAHQKHLDDLQGQLIHMARVSALNEMGATLAHELNQPLTAIMLYLDALKRIAGMTDAANSAVSVDEIVQKTVREADRAGSIIRRLRQFVERKETNRQSVDLMNVVDDAIGLASLGSPALGIDIRVERSPEPLFCVIDPIQIQQIVVNLVRNAIDAIGETGIGDTVEIACMASGDDAVMSVIDNGPGVEPEIKDALFKAFVTTKSTGLGIGLSIAQSIAQNHGGTLTVDVPDTGHGACFLLRLPLDLDAHPVQ